MRTLEEIQADLRRQGYVLKDGDRGEAVLAILDMMSREPNTSKKEEPPAGPATQEAPIVPDRRRSKNLSGT